MNKLLIAAGAILTLSTAPAMALNFDGANNVIGADIELAPAPSFDSVKLTADTIIFPATGDDFFQLSGSNYWNEGDFVSGVRVLNEGADTVEGTIFVDNNSLNCDTQDHVLTVDGQVITNFSIAGVDAQVEIGASFPAIGAGEHTFTITTTETVDSGCGSANFTFDVSVLDFDGGGDTGGPSCSSTGEMPLGAAATMGLALVLGVAVRRRN